MTAGRGLTPPRAVIGLCLLLALGACQSPPVSGNANSGPIVVAAASDLRFAFKEMGELYQQETGRKAQIIFGSSGTLARQIENGAPVDVFASANVAYIDDLGAKGKIVGDTPQLYALGRIVLATGKQSGLALSGLRDLTRPEVKRIAIANPEHAPYGAAARQALESIELWEQLKPKLIYSENVTQAMQYVQTGNAEAGILPLSIAGVPDVDYVLIDDRLPQPLKQAIAVISGTKQETAARDFIALVSSPKGRSIMESFGFSLPASSQR